MICVVAKAAGAEVLGHPHEAMDGRQRGYSARDPEGNLWSFGTLRPEDSHTAELSGLEQPVGDEAERR